MTNERAISLTELIDSARVSWVKGDVALTGYLLNAALTHFHAAQILGKSDPADAPTAAETPETVHTPHSDYLPAWFGLVADGQEHLIKMDIPAGAKGKRRRTDYAPESVVRALVQELARRVHLPENKNGTIFFGGRELANELNLEPQNTEQYVRVGIRLLEAHGKVEKRSIRRGNLTYRVSTNDIEHEYENLMQDMGLDP